MAGKISSLWIREYVVVLIQDLGKENEGEKKLKKHFVLKYFRYAK